MTYFCSLGFHCHSSQILIRNKLKKESYPFDWIFSNMLIIIDSIENDFKLLLNQNYYIDIENNPKGCGHSLLKFNLFPHKDMRIKENYNYLKRCIYRFKKMCSSNEEKIFLITVINTNMISNIYKNLTNLNEILKHKTTNYKILCLVFNNYQKENKHHIEINDNIHIIYIDVLTHSNGLKFENEMDNIYIDNIIKNNYIKT